MMWLYILCLSLCVCYVYYWWNSRTWVDGLHKKAVLITGCDTGFGNAAARSLYGRGVYVFAGCYTESGAAKLRQETGDRLNTLILDVTSSTSIQEAYRYVTANLPAGIEFWGLVNNAGIGTPYALFEFCKMEDFHKVFAVNFFGMVEMTQTFLPLLKASKGRLVNVASLIAELPGPDIIPYATSKWAIKGFTESLRVEKAIWKIKVCTIEPMAFRTNIALCNKELMEAGVKQMWERADPALRQQYGQQYLEKMLEEKLSRDSKFVAADLSPVVRAYEDALFSRRPQNIYIPGADFLRYAPFSLMESIFFNSNNIPQALKQ